MLFFPLINVKMSTIVGILTFMSWKKFMLIISRLILWTIMMILGNNVYEVKKACLIQGWLSLTYFGAMSLRSF